MNKKSTAIRIQFKFITYNKRFLALWERQLNPSLKNKTRAMIQFVAERNNLGTDLIGAEIGVRAGSNAASILSTLPIKKLYLIDPYLEYEGLYLKKAEKKLKKFVNKIEFVREMSDKAASALPNNLDFVYIDGNHDYEYVISDILNYYPKIKAGGILGGHDFSTDLLGVVQAVFEFVNNEGLKLYHRKVFSAHDWWIIKK